MPKKEYWVIPQGSGSGIISLGATGCDNDLLCKQLTESGCLIFNSGIHGEWRSGNVPHPLGTDFWVTGPQIGQPSGGLSCVAYTPMGQIRNVPYKPFDQIEIGSGLKLHEMGNCDYTITGPKIGQTGNCMLGDVAFEPFTEIEISSGLKLEESSSPECKYKITGPTITWTGCPNPGEAYATHPMYNLIIGSGIRYTNNPFDTCESTIEGARIGQDENGCKGEGGVLPLLPFEDLTFGSGLQLRKTGECEYVLDACPSGSIIDVGATGCDNNLECSGMSGCLIFGSGLYGEWICNTDFLVTGPKVSYGGAACGGEDGDAESFDHLTFTSGLTAVKASDDSDECSWIIGGPIINQEGCGAAPGPDYSIQKLIIGSGLKLSAHSGGNPCWHVISGPELGGAVDSEGAPVGTFEGAYAEPFRELWAGAGIKLLQTDESLCKYEISTTFEVGATGCGNDVECSGISGCLVFSSGLEGNWKDAPGGDFHVTGPKIDATLCGAETIDKPFTKLIFTSGMHVSNVKDGEDETCEYNVSGPTIERQNCAGNQTAIALGNLIIGSGLSFSDGEDCEVTIGGAKIGSNGEEADFFDHLVVGKGLKLTNDREEHGIPLDKCQFTLEADEREVGATGCGNDVECTGMSGCLVFSSGLYGYWKDAPGGDFWVEGPKVGYSGSDCGKEDIAAEPFDQLIFRSGLTAAKLTEDGCSWVVGGPKIQNELCGSSEPQDPLSL